MATPISKVKKEKVKTATEELIGNQVNRIDLLNHLEAVNPGLAKKDMLEQASHYIFSNGRIITYNDQISVSVPYEDITGNFSVRANEFYRIINDIKEDIVYLREVGEGDKYLNIATETTKAQLSVTTEETTVIELFRSLNIEKQKIKKFKNPDNFLTGLNFCKFCASKDLTADTLFCVAVTGDKVMAADDLRASFFSLEEKLPSMLIPATSLDQLVHYPIDSYAIDESWTHFFTESGVTYSCRSISGNFPDIVTFINEVAESEDSISFELPGELSEALDACIPMAKGKTPLEKVVTISYKKDKITVTAEKELGKLTKTVPYKSNKVITFEINPIFLKDILGTCDHFTLYTERDVILFSTDSFNHIISVEIADDDSKKDLDTPF